MTEMRDRDRRDGPDQAHGESERPPAAALLRLAGVHKYYGNRHAGVHALRGIDLLVHEGETLILHGPRASGKTSLLHVIGMLDAVSAGAVILADLLVTKLSDQARADLRAELIGFVFQTFTLIPVMTARENVVLPLLLRAHLSPAALRAAYARADDLLAQLGLEQQGKAYPPRLDASQSQRVAIARALIAAPRLVLADEPDSHLDPGCARLMRELFAREQRAHGTSFVIATPDQRRLQHGARSVHMAAGRLHAGPRAQAPVRTSP